MTVPVFLFEPSASIKRNRFAETVSSPRKILPDQLPEVKQHLKTVRQYSLENLPSLVKQFEDNISSIHRTRVRLARDADEAIKYIGEICGSTRIIAVNNSAVITKELAPSLRHTGFIISESYLDQFPAFKNQFQLYWQLPSIEFNALQASFSPPVDLNQLRRKELIQKNARDFVAVLGAGAASASDGSIYLLQHARNISAVYQQAKKIVLVIGLEKLTGTAEDALFQTRCMAYFGAEARLLDMQSPARTGLNFEEIQRLSTEPGIDEIDIILLDNGRLRLLNSPYRQLLTCINCRACLRGCPTYQYFGGPHRWCPKEYVYFYALGRNSSLDLCLQCGLCRSLCPLDIDIPGLIVNSRSRKRQPFINTLLASIEAIGKQATIAPSLTNNSLDNAPLRWLAELALGLSKERHLPEFQKRSLLSLLKMPEKQNDE